MSAISFPTRTTIPPVRSALAAGIAACALVGCTSSPTAESVEVEPVEADPTTQTPDVTPDTDTDTDAGGVESAPSTESVDAVPDTQADEVDADNEAAADGEASGYTLADAATADDPRAEDVECEYLTNQESDDLARVLDFRADRNRFFDIETDVVLESRTEGLTFTEIAADFGYSATDVQDGAAAMHGFCFEQLIGPNLTEAAAESRFQATMLRFAERADAEPIGDGDGRPVDPGIER